MQAASNKISFAEDVKTPIINHPDSDEKQRKMSIGSADGERLRRLSTNSSIPEGVVLEPQDKQDWKKTTADRDTWAHQERRRLSGWSNTDVATFKHREGRRGSVFSMWAPGKDKDGNDILMHDDHNDRSDARSESGRSDGGAAGSYGNTLMPHSPKENAARRASNNSDRNDRRGSVLSLWKGGKDAKGNDILGGDDEEWAR